MADSDKMRRQRGTCVPASQKALSDRADVGDVVSIHKGSGSSAISSIRGPAGPRGPDLLFKRLRDSFVPKNKGPTGGQQGAIEFSWPFIMATAAPYCLWQEGQRVSFI